MNPNPAFIPHTHIPNEVLDEWLADLTGTELKVVLFVARATNSFTDESRIPSVQEISRNTRLKKTTVRRALRLLTVSAKYADRFSVNRSRPRRQDSIEDGNTPFSGG